MSRYHFGVLSGTDGVNLPNNRTIIFEGGPEAEQRFNTPQLDSETGDITLTWTGAEGESYRIENSSNLENWKVLEANARTTTKNIGTNVDPKRLAAEPQKFYRSTLTALEAFDDNGFDYTSPINPTFSAIFSDLPPLNQISSVTVGGVTATVLGSSGNTLFLQFETEDLAAGDYAAVVTYTSGGGSSTQVSSANTHNISAPPTTSFS